MHEPDSPAWILQWARRKIDRRLTMTPEEKKESADRLARIIMAFFDKQTPSTNQEAIEILGIATMYYHSFVYASGMSEIREKP